MKRLLLIAFSTLLLTAARAGPTPQVPEGQPADSVARVGDQTITYSQLNTQLNSSPVVGLSVPVLGSAERNTVMLTLLDKAISVNLLYLDAGKRGTDQDPVYRKDLETFSDAILGELYRRKFLIGDIELTPEEVDAFIRENFTADTEITDRLRLSTEATIRNNRFAKRTASNRERLRDGVEVVIHADKLDIADDSIRGDDEVIAEFGDRRIAWGDAKGRLTTLNNSVNAERRIESLNSLVDQQLMARKGREAGLDQEPTYRKRLAEFRKTRLLNLHREKLVASMEPTDEELRTYYQDNQDRIAVKERRKILMLVLESREQAEQVKAKIGDGEITIYEAARDYSIHPDAKQNLGDFGWVAQGTGFPELEKVTFALAPDEIGGPVESPAGWHLVKVMDMRDARFTDIGEDETRSATRRLCLKEKMNDYVVELRKNQFPVVVYDENLKRLFQQEAQWIAAKTREMEANPERAQQILDEMRKVVE